MNKINLVALVAGDLALAEKQVRDTMELLDSGSSVPFIARYRKERTGSLDEIGIKAIRDSADKWRNLNSRKESILKSLNERELLDKELEEKIVETRSLSELEDIYLPFRPKRRTRATAAREKGLEPLAKAIYAQNQDPVDISKYVRVDDDVPDEQSAVSGALDIIAEWINENATVREMVRTLFEKKALLQSKVLKSKMDEAVKFRDYYDWNEPLGNAPGHRIHAILRGMKEGFLCVYARPGEEEVLTHISKYVVTGNDESSEYVSSALKDAYKRLILPSIEGECITNAKMSADEEAIRVFASNLNELLMASPLGQRIVLAIDPGFRTGCKVAVLDAQGKFLQNETIYPTLGEKQKNKAADIVSHLCGKYNVDAIAVGNGTAGRETEAFLKELSLKIPVIQVNESGASIYSASEAARDEFPDLDVTVRGAVSIGRRLQDPLAELVKIDPKSIGVGQYQHDVNQIKLKSSLDDVVVSCVNAVGVEVNTASPQLLKYVSGIGDQTAKNILKYREEKGPFKSREELRNVPRLGAFAYEQAAGFLRIQNGDNPLDGSAVHPERYDLVKKMANDKNCTIAELMEKETLRKEVSLSLNDYITEDAGLPTLKDILNELEKPGRDPRPDFEVFSFSDEVHDMEHLETGMKLPGIVTNVTNFGAFVDIGVHQDGLVHISQLANKFVKDPSEVVRVSQKVMVTVLDVDIERKRISLSMKK